jgi:hypothetical protein
MEELRVTLDLKQMYRWGPFPTVSATHALNNLRACVPAVVLWDARKCSGFIIDNSLQKFR